MKKPASGSKKPEFYATGQTYIELVDPTANVEFVLGTIQKRWGNNFVLVVCYLSLLVDAGINFWKSPNRKLYDICEWEKESLMMKTQMIQKVV